jgi:hypothetical protein
MTPAKYRNDTQPILGDDCKCWNALIDDVAYWWAQNIACRIKDEAESK